MTANRDRLCGDPAALAGYLYDDCEPDERAAVSAHLATCERCAADLAALRGTRDVLAAWTPPQSVPIVRVTPEPAPVPAMPRRWAWLAQAGWGQAAAAVLLFALGAGAAAVLNVDVRYDAAGVTVRTGWASRPDGVAADAGALDERIRAIVKQTQAAPAGAVASTAVASSGAPSGAPAAGNEDLLHRVEQMVTASEARQQQQLALRVSQVLHDVDSQHQADIARIERTVSPVAGLTAQEIQEQRQMLNYLMRVSQTK